MKKITIRPFNLNKKENALVFGQPGSGKVFSNVVLINEPYLDKEDKDESIPLEESSKSMINLLDILDINHHTFILGSPGSGIRCVTKKIINQIYKTHSEDKIYIYDAYCDFSEDIKTMNGEVIDFDLHNGHRFNILDVFNTSNIRNKAAKDEYHTWGEDVLNNDIANGLITFFSIVMEKELSQIQKAYISSIAQELLYQADILGKDITIESLKEILRIILRNNKLQKEEKLMINELYLSIANFGATKEDILVTKLFSEKTNIEYHNHLCSFNTYGLRHSNTMTTLSFLTWLELMKEQIIMNNKEHKHSYLFIPYIYDFLDNKILCDYYISFMRKCRMLGVTIYMSSNELTSNNNVRCIPMNANILLLSNMSLRLSDDVKSCFDLSKPQVSFLQDKTMAAIYISDKEQYVNFL